jgi:hypothetical protein
MISNIITVIVVLIAFAAGYFIIGRIYDSIFTKRKRLKIPDTGNTDLSPLDSESNPVDSKENLLYHTIRLIGKMSPKSDFHSNIRRTLLEDFIRREYRIDLTNYDETIKIIRGAQTSEENLSSFMEPVLHLSKDNAEFHKNLLKFLINHHSIDGAYDDETKNNLKALAEVFGIKKSYVKF